MALIAYLMEHKHNYGPHLIIVPNAVMVNWKSRADGLAAQRQVRVLRGAQGRARAQVQPGGGQPAVQRAGHDLRVHHARPPQAVTRCDACSPCQFHGLLRVLYQDQLLAALVGCSVLC